MPRFVILRHETPPQAQTPLHWDLMLEAEEGLRTWALATEPEVGPPIAARALADHRKRYLDYEGPVSDGRGIVRKWDCGEFNWLVEEGDELAVQLAGRRLRGRATLRLDPSHPQRWTVRFSPT